MAIGAISAFAVAPEQDPNPKKDKDVREGYDRHQEEHEEKKVQEKRKDKKEMEKPYEVDKSHQEHNKETEKSAGKTHRKNNRPGNLCLLPAIPIAEWFETVARPRR